MSDWITHLGVAFLGARVLRVQGTPLVLLGAVLPDVAIPVFMLSDMLHLSPWYSFPYLAPIHSPAIIALLALGIALLHQQPLRCAALIFSGALIHAVLDVLETTVDCGFRPLYPFSFHWWAPGWLAPGSTPAIALLGVGALGFVMALAAAPDRLGSRFHRKRIGAGMAVCGLAVALPVVLSPLLFAQNVHSLAFLSNPATWQGRSVDLCFSEVVASGPAVIEEFEQRFAVATKLQLQVGERVSLRGIYADGTLHPSYLVVHQGFSDAWLSLVGLAGLAIIWLRVFLPHRQQGFRRKVETV